MHKQFKEGDVLSVAGPTPVATVSGAYVWLEQTDFVVLISFRHILRGNTEIHILHHEHGLLKIIGASDWVDVSFVEVSLSDKVRQAS